MSVPTPPLSVIVVTKNPGPRVRKHRVRFSPLSVWIAAAVRMDHAERIGGEAGRGTSPCATAISRRRAAGSGLRGPQHSR